MRNMKKFLALVLAMMMMLSVAVFNTSAAEEADYTDAALFLNSLAVMQGSTDGDLMLDAGVERYQAALFFARCLTGKTETEIWNGTPASAYFTDVTMYGTAIDYAYGMGVVKGRGGNLFGANDKIIYQDMIVMAVRALGYETENMSYPWGHIIAAEKLGLLEGIESYDYKAVMTRGEVAKLLENTLNTEVAAIDPVTKEPIYPVEGETVKNSLDKEVAFVKLLSKAGFVGGTPATIEYVAFNFYTAEELAEDEELFNSVTVKVNGDEFDVKAEDLDVTEETLEKYYIGFTADVYYNGAEFTEEAYTEGEVAIVYIDKDAYTTVECLNDGAVKYTVSNNKHYLTLGTEKIEFTDGKTLITVKEWDGDSWNEKTVDEAIAYAQSLEYTAKEGYKNASTNTFGKVEYRTWTVDEQAYAEVLVTPYAFARLGEVELKYTPTATVEKFVTLATAANSADEEGNYFTNETLVTGYSFGTKTSINKSNGEAALNVKVEGNAKAGDFVLYEYNKADNVLTIAAVVADAITTGRITGTNNDGEYKIAGTYYAPATYFAGVAVKNLINVDERITAEGDATVQYIAYNGEIIFIANYSEDGGDDVDVAFAIIDEAPEKIAEVLDVEVDELNVVNGLVIEDGNVVVAMLNLTTGEWETAKVAAVATSYDDTDKEYTDLVKFDKYELRDELGLDKDTDSYAGVKAILDDVIVAVVANEDGAYTIAAEVTGSKAVTKNTGDFTLEFSAAGLSNKVTADTEVDAARVQTAEGTVVVAINGTTVGVRTGVQTAETKLSAVKEIYSANANLIVVKVEDTILDWVGVNAASDDENYYVVTPAYKADVEYDAENENYIVTVTGLYDLRTFAMADTLTFTVAKATGSAAVTNYFKSGSDILVGNVVVYNTKYAEEFEAGKTLKAGDSITATLAAINTTDAETFYTVSDLTVFEDAYTLAATIGGKTLTDKVAVSGINMSVAVLDNSNIDWADYDLTTMYVSSLEVAEADEDKYEGVSTTTVDSKTYYEFAFDVAAENDEITEPSELLNQFIIDMAGKTITVSGDEVADETFTYTLNVVANYDEKADTVTAVVVIVLN